MSLDMIIGILLYIAGGFYLVPLWFNHADKCVEAINEKIDPAPSQVIAVFLTWALALPVLHYILHKD